MSGGTFNFKQNEIGNIADEIQDFLDNRPDKAEDWGAPPFSEATITEFHNAVKFLRTAQIYADRVDWLLAGDNSEEGFHQRLKDKLEQLTEENNAT